ncbi:S-adenosylmethionine decarboxylase proenzyme [Eumeta japonica]|uniref:S-adenosylmethionine decarboxylase proenzyme n=1 Tax=Eumeta variegata TaxID=151549 RepID=A0A4C1X271_EUMVA|nr:S-adenosylmethionine decarboxylase proenzyme [Eumeta japonica]
MAETEIISSSDNSDQFFEGVEKLIEIWFTPVKNADLRKITRQQWENVLKSVRCEIISFIKSDQVDAYVLREFGNLKKSLGADFALRHDSQRNVRIGALSPVAGSDYSLGRQGRMHGPAASPHDPTGVAYGEGAITSYLAAGICGAVVADIALPVRDAGFDSDYGSID